MGKPCHPPALDLSLPSCLFLTQTSACGCCPSHLPWRPMMMMIQKIPADIVFTPCKHVRCRFCTVRLKKMFIRFFYACYQWFLSLIDLQSKVCRVHGDVTLPHIAILENLTHKVWILIVAFLAIFKFNEAGNALKWISYHNRCFKCLYATALCFGSFPCDTTVFWLIFPLKMLRATNVIINDGTRVKLTAT